MRASAAGVALKAGKETLLKSESCRCALGPASRSSIEYICRRTTELPMKSRSCPASRQRVSAVPIHLRPHCARLVSSASTSPSTFHLASPTLSKHSFCAGLSSAVAMLRKLWHWPAGSGAGCCHRCCRIMRPRSDSSTVLRSVCRQRACSSPSALVRPASFVGLAQPPWNFASLALSWLITSFLWSRYIFCRTFWYRACSRASASSCCCLVSRMAASCARSCSSVVAPSTCSSLGMALVCSSAAELMAARP
mmetsp:Transcript_28977/g.68295  ORF Transcript_28977/g.68295 Transcript_28977/m.68295 type:complete len:251 (+) Transcript_28977:313-1065(+)